MIFLFNLKCIFLSNTHLNNVSILNTDPYTISCEDQLILNSNTGLFDIFNLELYYDNEDYLKNVPNFNERFSESDLIFEDPIEDDEEEMINCLSNLNAENLLIDDTNKQNDFLEANPDEVEFYKYSEEDYIDPLEIKQVNSTKISEEIIKLISSIEDYTKKIKDQIQNVRKLIKKQKYFKLKFHKKFSHIIDNINSLANQCSRFRASGNINIDYEKTNGYISRIINLKKKLIKFEVTWFYKLSTDILNQIHRTKTKIVKNQVFMADLKTTLLDLNKRGHECIKYRNKIVDIIDKILVEQN